MFKNHEINESEVGWLYFNKGGKSFNHCRYDGEIDNKNKFGLRGIFSIEY